MHVINNYMRLSYIYYNKINNIINFYKKINIEKNLN